MLLPAVVVRCYCSLQTASWCVYAVLSFVCSGLPACVYVCVSVGVCCCVGVFVTWSHCDEDIKLHHRLAFDVGLCLELGLGLFCRLFCLYRPAMNRCKCKGKRCAHLPNVQTAYCVSWHQPQLDHWRPDQLESTLKFDNSLRFGAAQFFQQLFLIYFSFLACSFVAVWLVVDIRTIISLLLSIVSIALGMVAQH